MYGAPNEEKNCLPNPNQIKSDKEYQMGKTVLWSNDMSLVK